MAGDRAYECGAARPPTLVLAHGAGAGHDQPWMRRVARGLADRGVRVITFNFPYTASGRKIPDRRPVLEASFREAWIRATARARGPVLAGGKSLGGRIASQVAAGAALSPEPAGLVFLGYPLHPPGKPDRRRDQHLPDISVPMLFVSGTRDPFGSPEEMTALTDDLPRARLHLVDGGDHSLVARKRDDPDGRGFELALDLTAAWIRSIDS
jgi:predicted alpha/beta-hydrolase family hydrolase